MKENKLFWIPRVIAIVYIVFLSLFSLDVFSLDATLPQKLIGFLIHLIPSYMLIIALIFAWRKPIIGGVTFVVLGVLFSVFFRININNLLTFLIIPFPPAIIGTLFIIFEILTRRNLRNNISYTA